MSDTSATIERIVKLLCEGQRYRRERGSFTVGQISISFSFGTVLLGPGAEDDIVLIEDYAGTPSFRLLNQLQALHAALSRASSVRSLSLILVDFRDEPNVVEQLREMARVLEVSSTDAQNENRLREAISILLPLPASGTTTMPKGEEMFLEDAGPELKEPLLGLVRAWDHSPTQLQHQFLTMVENVISEIEGDSHD